MLIDDLTVLVEGYPKLINHLWCCKRTTSKAANCWEVHSITRRPDLDLGFDHDTCVAIDMTREQATLVVNCHNQSLIAAHNFGAEQ